MRFFFLASTQRSPHSAYSAAPFSRSCFAPLNADTRSKAAPLCVTGRVCRSRCRVLRNVYGLGCVHRAVDSARAGSAIALCCREFLFCSAHAGKEQRKRRDANSSGVQNPRAQPLEESVHGAREPASIAALCVSGLELFRDRYGCLFDATPSLPITARREREKSERGSANSPGRSVFSGIAPPVMQCAFSYFWEKGFGAFFFLLLLTLPLRDLPCRLRRSGSSVYGVLSGGCKERQRNWW